MNKIEYSDRLNLDEIAELVPPIHPALDWVKGQLIMGVVDTNGKRAILSSKGSWVSPKELGRPICPKGREFTSPVTTVAAKTFLEGQGTNIQGASGEAVAGKIASYLRRLLAFPEDWMADAVSVWILCRHTRPQSGLSGIPVYQDHLRESGVWQVRLGASYCSTGIQGRVYGRS